MGLMAAAAVFPADAGFLTIAFSYIAVGSLTFISVVFFAMLHDAPEDEEMTEVLRPGE